MLQDKRIGFIGGGAMAEALIRGMLKARLIEPENIYVNDVQADRLAVLANTYSVVTCTSSKEIVERVDVLFLAVKPQVVQSVLESLSSIVSSNLLVVSIVAGLKLSVLQEKLPDVAVIRVMPNTPIAVGEGMAAIALGKHADATHDKLVTSIFAANGKAVTVHEDAMDAVTGLSGSGPGYAFVIIDALADAGVRVGLPRQTAITLAAQTLLGAAKMVLETGEHPAKLRDMVTSPGGTTIAGIHVMEQKAVRAALIDAVEAATIRSQEMGKK